MIDDDNDPSGLGDAEQVPPGPETWPTPAAEFDAGTSHAEAAARDRAAFEREFRQTCSCPLELRAEPNGWHCAHCDSPFLRRRRVGELA